MSKYIAIFKHTVQTSHETWHVVPEAKICDENTTVGEIMKWVYSFTEKPVFSVELVQEKTKEK